jgi:uncharacterized SAM-binding protein YcdF (DUF218 family)
MDKNRVGIFLFLLALIVFFISGSLKMTGNVIGDSSSVNPIFLLGLVFLIASFMAFVSRQKLDAIVIPTGGSQEIDMARTEEAVKEYLLGEKQAKKIIISGYLGGKPISESQMAAIYKRLRQHRIKPSEMGIEGKSANSLENLLYTIKKVKKKGARSIGIASNPSHLDRYEDILAAAKKEGLVDKDFKMYRLETDESFADRFYGFISRIFYRYKLSAGIEEAKKRKTPSWLKKLANFGYKLMGKK